MSGMSYKDEDDDRNPFYLKKEIENTIIAQDQQTLDFYRVPKQEVQISNIGTNKQNANDIFVNIINDGRKLQGLEPITTEQLVQTKTGAWCAPEAKEYWDSKYVDETEDEGIDLDRLKIENPFNLPSTDDDDLGIDLDQLNIKQADISKHEIDLALKDLKETIEKSIQSEEGIDLTLFDKIKEEKEKVKTELAKAQVEKQKLIKEQRKFLEEKFQEEMQFAKKRIEDCSSWELNKRTEEELLRKQQDDEFARRISYVNKRTEVSKETLKQFKDLLEYYKHPSVSRHFKEMKEIEE